MIDRVSNSVGRLGPVGDADAMARNILDVWQADRSRMAEAAQLEALKFSWDHSMDRLFAHVYPAAFARRSSPLVPAPAAAAVAA
jgi:alpha-1,6-mannosyltransferase